MASKRQYYRFSRTVYCISRNRNRIRLICGRRCFGTVAIFWKRDKEKDKSVHVDSVKCSSTETLSIRIINTIVCLPRQINISLQSWSVINLITFIVTIYVLFFSSYFDICALCDCLCECVSVWFAFEKRTFIDGLHK